MSERTSEELLFAFADGDMPAFETLYNRYKSPIKGYIYSKTRSQASADDITQLVWEKVIKSATRLKAEHSEANKAFSFKPYLYRIAQNLITDVWRSDRVVPISSLSGTSEYDLVSTVESDSAPVVDLISLQELTACVESKLMQFKQGFIEAFRLTRDGHLGYSEAAEVMGVNVETLRSRVKAVLLGIKPCLEGHKNA
ncbi:RNA polymerase sigma factor [Congregibacter litoralis]|uniref:RNA polymerase sigma factor, sigma-70 family n=1 Tax=Congregibacter litoralis KT71 TaxID=314285 RepID=A4AD60_9GAMM|nr:sigma-70 family RNA polymerase sigma factor [Congregibacter litoralis]EAQ96113.1 RNA polymerase sigma factor, sigma-70 family [Congregibacter litoralis KT71]